MFFDEKTKKVLIIGAGLSGSFFALEAASRGYKVVLLEKGNKVLPEGSTSLNQCFKLHTGIHYVGDVQTAVQCLEDSVMFARSIPKECLIGFDNLNKPWRRGRHFLMSNSLFSLEEFMETAITLKKKYEELVLKDKENQVFGDPANFIKFLSSSEYGYISDNILFENRFGNKEKIKVVAGLETGESQIDVDKLRAYFVQEISKNNCISFMPNTEVINLSYLSDGLGYSITAIVKNKKREIKAPLIVNCAWEKIEYLGRDLGFYSLDKNRVIRAKLSIRVKLPESLTNIHTCIFSSGPFVSITNMGDGEAILTSEQTTNIFYYKPLNNLFFRKDNEEIKLLEKKILLECSHYIPDLVNSKILSSMVGYVKMMNQVVPYNGLESLFSKESGIHQRIERGIEIPSGSVGYIENSGNKMTYTLKNSKIACDKLDFQFKLFNILSFLLKIIKNKLGADLIKFKINYSSNFIDIVSYACLKSFYLSTKSFEELNEVLLNDFVNNFFSIMKSKKSVCEEINDGTEDAKINFIPVNIVRVVSRL